MSNKELQEEEIEVLRSIYDGDEAFKEVNATTFQYKIGEEESYRSFLVEVLWHDDYPAKLPNINLNAFFNKHILPEVKSSITEKMKAEVEPLEGDAVTYSVFEYAKENADELMAEQPEAPPQNQYMEERLKAEESRVPEITKVKERKEQFSKAQKKKMYEKLDSKTGEKPRGHDWVDIIRHLSQTGGKES